MPLYEYKCQDCGVFDAWRSLTERDCAPDCPTCDLPSHRIFSPPTAMLSGSLRLKVENPEPKLVKKDLEPKKQTIKHHTGGRPWAIGH